MSADDKRPRMNWPHLTSTATHGKISLKQPIEMIMYGRYDDVHHYIFWLVNEAGETCSDPVLRIAFKVEDKLWQTFLSNKQVFNGKASSGDTVTVMFNGSASGDQYSHEGQKYVIE
ncbi:hypothetical protein EC919_10993 [Pseudomonas graminis]|uniref:hypothetical protein n=1 Tax=Pseudomonas graminis TaxID=158627 RepID=UPI00105F2D52|nr:hypothetical protein [Pseudomonas graminis]TDV48149.1 hypothetical protein EC919_10993 [Pseudomonas graminis]